MKNRVVGQNEEGFASLVIAIVLVLILSLMTIGFAQLMRREERSALDKQLSSQAYYAAESGVNDATKAIADGYKGAKTGCGVGQGVDSSNPAYAAGLADLSSNVVSTTTGATYPCLLINPTPPNLYYPGIKTTQGRNIEFTAVDSTGAPTAVTSITLSWQDHGNNTTFHPGNCTGDFKTTDNWPYIGVLRAQLTPVGTALDRTTLANASFTAFLCPNSSVSGSPGSTTYSANIGPSNAGIITNGNCNASSSEPVHCNVSITSLPVNQATFFLNLRSIYFATDVTITAFNGSTQLDLSGAQTLVDSTGKAQDVLRRLQVRIPSSNGYDIPDGVHADICKQFDLDPAATTVNGTGCSAGDLSL